MPVSDAPPQPPIAVKPAVQASLPGVRSVRVKRTLSAGITVVRPKPSDPEIYHAA